MKPTSFQITRSLFLFTFLVLIVFGVGSFLRIGGNSDRMGLYILYALAMLGDAALMGFCAWQLPRRTKFIFFTSIVVLAFNIVPTIFDQFGIVDLLFLLLNLATLVALFSARKEFLPS